MDADLVNRSSVVYSLSYPDITTVARMAEAINSLMGADIARAMDPESVRVIIPLEHRNDVLSFLSRIEVIEVDTDTRSKVVMDERTGTVVMGEGVRIKTVAISHGNLSIQIKETPQVSQPVPLGQGQTVVTPETQVEAKEEKARLMLLKPGATIGELVRALNAVGVTPRDLIAILQSIKAAGALEADLEVI